MAEALIEARVVIDRICELVMLDQWRTRRASSLGFSFGDAFNGGEKLFSHFRFKTANRQAKLGVVGNNVVLGAGLKVSHCYDRHFPRLDFAGNDSLQGNYCPCR